MSEKRVTRGGETIFMSLEGSEEDEDNFQEDEDGPSS